MEENIIQAVATLKRNFAYLWFAALLIVILGETGGFNLTGAYADNVRAVYFTETIVILLTACCVPAALKLFAWVKRKKIDADSSTQKALGQYVMWSSVRILLLAVPVLCGIIGYYLMQSTSCILCTCIALTASLFCIPSEKQLKKDMMID
ncbi:MAG: hypothetical protein IJT46_01660 [Bacteroidaceae bacterium]|nr:hypothetical protein [Bacteroidaceae bacterium]MBQ8008197.1 hypothetical protein [Bacteroidaceae bacterium]MBR1542279.1 hypothetical protein [Bacteroidaceae bacterium]